MNNIFNIFYYPYNINTYTKGKSEIYCRCDTYDLVNQQIFEKYSKKKIVRSKNEKMMLSCFLFILVFAYSSKMAERYLVVFFISS